MIEAIAMAEELTGQPMQHSYAEDNRVGDHIWWISDVSKFQKMYPGWHYRYDIRSLMADIHEGVRSRNFEATT
jgi:CDP-paratose 2-epimerase